MEWRARRPMEPIRARNSGPRRRGTANPTPGQDQQSQQEPDAEPRCGTAFSIQNGSSRAGTAYAGSIDQTNQGRATLYFLAGWKECPPFPECEESDGDSQARRRKKRQPTPPRDREAPAVQARREPDSRLRAATATCLETSTKAAEPPTPEDPAGVVAVSRERRSWC